MRITASHIVDWANTHTKEAQQELPRLVRRLSFEPGSTQQIAFPSGDSTYVPGWDGVTITSKGNAWVPSGDARWEIGCDQNIQSKVNQDYNKRTDATDVAIRKNATFIFITPRRWTKKAAWIEQKKAEDKWLDIRIYDADDLEQWLEQTPAIALQFSEELGLNGWGVMSPERYWKNWSQQCKPKILADAFIGDRIQIQNKLKEKIIGSISNEEMIQPIVIRADSVEEATAFAIVTMIGATEVTDKTLVVTKSEGWRFVETNTSIKIAIAASTEVASNAIVREGLLVIVPHSLGDLAAKFNDIEVVLERPDMYEFEKALISIGMEESDAKRFAASSGRSWTVFRRQQAINPALKNPIWLETRESESLSVLCLINAWNSHKQEDRRVVEQISGCAYEEVERNLHMLSLQDNSPVLKIGGVWKAKSALELLSIFGGRIPSDQIDHFFTVTEEMLSTPDPQLELSEDKRWMAQIYGKTHPYSGLLFDSVCDSLIKLAVLGSEHSGLSALNLELRVSYFVEKLFNEADDVRWLSLASYLPTLAEAAPDMFLKAIENSLNSEEKSVTRLITETSESSSMGRCWHAGLLWALEKLAWSPRRLARVSLILARLTYIPIKGNWGNKPGVSLQNLFRSWKPQTAADLAGRIQVLDLLIDKEPKAAYQLLEKLLEKGSQIATPSNRPDWRDDDAGAGHGATEQEHYDMLIAVKKRLLTLAEYNADRIASLLNNTILGHQDELSNVLPLIQPFIDGYDNDIEREKIRTSLRDIIHWHRNYDKANPVELNKWLVPIELYYEQISPSNPVVCYRWLFSDYWIDLPIQEVDNEHKERQDLLTHERIIAIKEIFEIEGVVSLDKLIWTCGEPGTVGEVLSQLSWDNASLLNWIVEKGGDFTTDSKMSWCLSAYLRSLSSEKITQLLQSIILYGKKKFWEPEKFVQFLILARPDRQTWNVLDSCDEIIKASYWQLVTPQYRKDDGDIEFVLEQLYLAERPLTALQYCKYSIDKISVKQLYDLLNLFLQGKEVNGPRLDSWHLSKMLKHLEGSDEIEKMALIQLEFSLFPTLGYRNKGNSGLLYKVITTEPERFNELIRLAFKPKHGKVEESTDISKRAADTSRSILRECKRIPGTQDDCSVDEKVMVNFIDSVFKQSQIDERLCDCELTLGGVLAHCQSNKDESWPLTSISRLLDRPELENMRRGFLIGVYNKRGVTTRSHKEGGRQERVLAHYYRKQAEQIQYIYPNTSEILEKIAIGYESDAKREDDEAGLRKEGF